MADPAPVPDASSSAAPPDWYSHGLNRLFYYRLAQAAASALPRPVRRRLARGLGLPQLFDRTQCPMTTL